MSTSMVERIANASGLVLKRERKHRVLGDELGRTFTLPSTPSDRQWERNAMSTLAKLLGKTKAELMPSHLPLRTERNHSTLTKAERIAPAQVWSRKELKEQKRRARYANARADKHRGQMEEMERVVGIFHDFCVKVFDPDVENHVLQLAVNIATAMQRIGHNECEVMLVTIKGDESSLRTSDRLHCFPVLKVRSGLYLDFVENEVRTQDHWIVERVDDKENVEVEAVLSLKELARGFQTKQ